MFCDERGKIGFVIVDFKGTHKMRNCSFWAFEKGKRKKKEEKPTRPFIGCMVTPFGPHSFTPSEQPKGFLKLHFFKKLTMIT